MAPMPVTTTRVPFRPLPLLPAMHSSSWLDGLLVEVFAGLSSHEKRPCQTYYPALVASRQRAVNSLRHAIHIFTPNSHLFESLS